MNPIDKQLITLQEAATIYAFRTDKEQIYRDYIYKSVMDEGLSRYGWSAEDHNNLDNPKNHSRDINPDYGRTRFLLDIKEGDWIVHINCPKQDYCIAAQVVSAYKWNQDGEKGDWRHYFEIDKDTIIKFNRNDKMISPKVQLKIQGEQWRIKAKEDFVIALNRLINPDGKEINHIMEASDKVTRDYLMQLAYQINKCHPGVKLEQFLKDVIEKLPGTDNVELVKTRPQHGADIIFDKDVIGGCNLQILVQVKSHEGLEQDITPISQIKEALDWYKDYNSIGIIMTTATEFSESFLSEYNKAVEESGRAIYLMDGLDIAKLVVTNSFDSIFKK